MFRKRKLVIISAAAAAMVVVAGIIGGAVYANSDAKVSPTSIEAGSSQAARNEGTDRYTVLAGKVAAILGLDNETVEAAFAQAQTEIESERAAERLAAQEARLDQLVKDGKLTAEEAAEMKAWMEAKPDVSIRGWGDEDRWTGRYCGPGGRGGGMMQRGERPGPWSEVTESESETATN